MAPMLVRWARFSPEVTVLPGWNGPEHELVVVRSLSINRPSGADRPGAYHPSRSAQPSVWGRPADGGLGTAPWRSSACCVMLFPHKDTEAYEPSSLQRLGESATSRVVYPAGYLGSLDG